MSRAAHLVAFEPRSGASWRDPYPMYAALRDHDPAHHVESGDYWVLTRFADVFAAARDHESYSSAEGLTFTYGERARIGLDTTAPLVMLDPPDHTAFRRLVSRAMTPRNIARLEERVRTYVDELLDAVDDLDRFDLVPALAVPVANSVVAHLLGVPDHDRSAFGVWTEAIVEANAQGDPIAAGERLGELLTYFAELVAWRRVEPGDDLLSLLVVREPGEPEVPLAQVLGFAFTMVAGGNDTVAGLIAGGAQLLAAHPGQRARLAAGPDGWPAAVEELLRLTSPVQGLARTTTRAVDVRGTQIPAGRKVLLAYGSANRDPREFGPDADDLRIDREVRRTMAFGSGAHHCLGAAAARLQGRVALAGLTERFPDLEVDDEAATFAAGNYVRRHDSLPVRTGRR